MSLDIDSVEYAYNNSEVEFVNVKDTYSCYTNLVCECIVHGSKQREGDRVGIYKVGWRKLKDHIACEVFTEPLKGNGKFYIVFDKNALPKNDDNELYQFCYIGKKNELFAASSTFRIVEFTEASRERPNSIEIEKLVKENATLRQALKLLVSVDTPAVRLDDLLTDQASQIDLLRKKVESLELRCDKQYSDNKYFVNALEAKYNELLSQHKNLELEFDEYKKSQEASDKLMLSQHEKLEQDLEKYRKPQEELVNIIVKEIKLDNSKEMMPKTSAATIIVPKETVLEKSQDSLTKKNIVDFDVRSLDDFTPLPPFPYVLS